MTWRWTPEFTGKCRSKMIYARRWAEASRPLKESLSGSLELNLNVESEAP